MRTCIKGVHTAWSWRFHLFSVSDQKVSSGLGLETHLLYRSATAFSFLPQHQAFSSPLLIVLWLLCPSLSRAVLESQLVALMLFKKLLFLFKLLFYFYLCVSVYVTICSGRGVTLRSKRAPNPLELESEAVMNCYELPNTGTGNRTLVLWKSSKNTSSPSHLSILALMLKSHEWVSQCLFSLWVRCARPGQLTFLYQKLIRPYFHYLSGRKI